MASATAQFNYNLAVQAGKQASNEFLRDQQNPNSPEAKKQANTRAAEAFDKAFEELEKNRKELEKGKSSDKSSRPLVVYDPYNRLTTRTRIDKPAPDVNAMLDMATRYAVSEDTDLSRRGPVTTPFVLSEDEREHRAFEAHIAGLDQQGLLDLKAHLFAYRDAMKTQPATVARNVKIRDAEWKISLINQKLPVSVRYITPKVSSSSLSDQKPVAEKNGVAPASNKIQCKGWGWAKRICNPGEDAKCTKMLPIERNQCTCCPPDKTVRVDGQSFDQGTVKPVLESPGTTVSTMPVVSRSSEGVKVDLNAPILDLYSTYGSRAYEREIAAIKDEIQRLEQPRGGSVSPQEVVAAEAVPVSKALPMMPAPVDSVGLEEATAKSVVGPVAMSASAANVPQKVNWWLLAGFGVAVLVFFGQTSKGRK